jgi:hypothetical protein
LIGLEFFIFKDELSLCCDKSTTTGATTAKHSLAESILIASFLLRLEKLSVKQDSSSEVRDRFFDGFDKHT